MRVIDPGHVYWVPNLETPARPQWMERLACWLAPKLCWLFGGQTVVFLKRSSKMVYYHDEHPGSNTQEYFRVTIDRTLFLNGIGESVETLDSVYYQRMSLWCYEARAWRRKQQKLNKQAQSQAPLGSPDSSRDGWDDIPFSEHEIELRPTNPDGHIIVRENRNAGVKVKPQTSSFGMVLRRLFKWS